MYAFIDLKLYVNAYIVEGAKAACLCVVNTCLKKPFSAGIIIAMVRGWLS